MAVATARCSPSAMAARAASAPSIAVTGATTETAPRPIAAYEKQRPAITPTPPTTIHASARPVGCCGSPSQTANGITSAIPISCTQTSACSEPISRVERLSNPAETPHATAAPSAATITSIRR